MGLQVLDLRACNDRFVLAAGHNFSVVGLVVE